MKDKEVMPADSPAENAEVRPAKRNPQIIMTIIVSAVLAVIFVADLVLFLLNMLEWYIFLVLLLMNAVVFPLALLIALRAGKIPTGQELRAEVESDLLKAADAPDPTRIYEE